VPFARCSLSILACRCILALLTPRQSREADLPGPEAYCLHDTAFPPLLQRPLLQRPRLLRSAFAEYAMPDIDSRQDRFYDFYGYYTKNSNYGRVVYQTDEKERGYGLAI
jgi:hypothetical protein